MKKTTNDNAAKLAKLNRIYKNLSRYSDKFAAEYQKVKADKKRSPKNFDRLDAKCKELSAEFEKLRSELPPVKFDMGLGEYFYAEVQGEEMFAIKVRPTNAYYVRLPARNLSEAVDKAKLMIAEQEKIPLSFLEAEDYSR